MMHVVCDDGSTNVKLAWFKDGEMKTSVTANSFRQGWKVDGLGGGRVYNYSLNGMRYTADNVSREAIVTTNVEYQYSDMNLLAVHHALLCSGLDPQPVSLTVTLPVSEYYDADCQPDEDNIRRKQENLMRKLEVNRGTSFTVTEVNVMPESLPAVFSSLAKLNVSEVETTLVIDLGGTTLDGGVIVGQFDSVSAVHGNPNIGVSMVTRAAMTAMRSAGSDTSAYVADQVVRNRSDRQFLESVINDSARVDYVIETIEAEIEKLGTLVVNDLAPFRHVNRVFLAGGGAELIENAVRNAWPLANDRICLLDDAQLALAREIALYRNEG